MHNLKVGDRFVSYMGAGEVVLKSIHPNYIVVHRFIQDDLIIVPNVSVIDNIKHLSGLIYIML